MRYRDNKPIKNRPKSLRVGISVIVPIIYTIFLLSGCHINQTTTHPKTGKQLNCLLIVIDTLRADHVGCYGNKDINTPAIDSLAREGVLFQNAFTPVPITLPSHASIMTGMYPSVHGVKDNGIFILDERYTTIAELLSSGGYTCAAFIGSFILDSRFGINQGFAVYDDQLGGPDLKSSSLYQERRAGAVTDAALNFLKGPIPEPFFLWLHYFDPHAPYDPPEPFKQEYKDSPYDGEIAYTDYQIDRILKFLRKRGALDDTLIILTADHGEGLGEHGETGHGVFIYDTTLHVPLIFRCPELMPQNRIVNKQVRTIDIFPTILELLGFNAVKTACNGKSILPYNNDGKKKGGGILHCSSDYPYLGFGWAPLEGIRGNGWKYIYAPRSELYNLKDDPGETKDLSLQQRGKMNSLHSDLIRIKKGASQEQADEIHIELDPVTQKRLLSLGYVSPGIQRGDIESLEIENLPDPKDKISIITDIDIGIADYTLGDLGEAKERFLSVTAKDPGNLLANFMLGCVYQIEKNLPNALASFWKVLTINPDYLDIHQHLGEIYMSLDNMERAYGEFLQATQVGLGRAEAYNSLAQIYGFRGELDKSIDAMNKALSIDPESAQIHYNLGTILEKKGEYKKAIKEYKTAIKLLPQYSEAWNNMGQLYIKIGKTNEGIPAIKKAISLNPDNATFHNNLGLAYEKLGQTKNSIKELEKAITLNPKSTAPIFNLAVIKTGQMDYIGAKNGFMRVIELNPDFTEAYYNLGMIYAKEGSIDDAIDTLREALRREPGNTNIRLLLENLRKFY